MKPNITPVEVPADVDAELKEEVDRLLRNAEALVKTAQWDEALTQLSEVMLLDAKNRQAAAMMDVIDKGLNQLEAQPREKAATHAETPVAAPLPSPAGPSSKLAAAHRPAQPTALPFPHKTVAAGTPSMPKSPKKLLPETVPSVEPGRRRNGGLPLRSMVAVFFICLLVGVVLWRFGFLSKNDEQPRDANSASLPVGSDAGELGQFQPPDEAAEDRTTTLQPNQTTATRPVDDPAKSPGSVELRASENVAYPPKESRESENNPRAKQGPVIPEPDKHSATSSPPAVPKRNGPSSAPPANKGSVRSNKKNDSIIKVGPKLSQPTSGKPRPKLTAQKSEP